MIMAHIFLLTEETPDTLSVLFLYYCSDISFSRCLVKWKHVKDGTDIVSDSYCPVDYQLNGLHKNLAERP